MNILIPILGFGRSGGARVLSELANAWLRCDHKVVFLCPDSSVAPYFPTSATILWVGVGAVPSQTRQTIAKSSWHYNLRSLIFGLKKIGFQYDVILANHSLTAWPVALASCGSAKKVYYVQAYEPEFSLEKNTFKGVLAAIVSAASYHLPLDRIVNSPVYFRYKNLRAKEFVPPGLDLSIFRPKGVEKDLTSAETIVIGCIGRIEPIKGTIYALRAFGELYKNDRRFLLRVAYGNLPENWNHSRCEVVVPKNDVELAQYYRSLDVLVAAGTGQHGAPHYPVLEAGACGVAIVTTGYMGATSETAWLVNNRDVQSIVSAIRLCVLKTSDRRNRIDSFLREAENYGWDSVAVRFISLFRQGSKHC